MAIIRKFAHMSIRQEKFAKPVQRDLAVIFQEKGREWFGNQLVSITEVKVTPDLSYVKVYLSMFTAGDRTAVMEAVELHSRDIRHELARRIRNEVRKVPELSFFADTSLDYAAKMDRIFDQLRKEPNTEDPT
jgi:ribosome-binding factor A